MDQSRPRTRGLEASEADEDAKFIKMALIKYKEGQEKVKGQDINIRNIHNNIKKEARKMRGSGQLPQFPFDDKGQVVKRRRGGRRNYRRRRPPIKPTPLCKTPFSGSAIQYKHVWYRVGDIVSVQKDETKYFAQILAFHTDQFCERYASIKWLLPKWKVDLDDTHLPPITVESFQGAVESEELVNLNCFKFILRPPSHHFQGQYPHVVKRDKLYVYRNEMYYFDSPSSTLTSAERRY